LATTRAGSKIIIGLVIVGILSGAGFLIFNNSEPELTQIVPTDIKPVKITLKTDLSKILHQSIIEGGEFLVRMQNPDGSYKYSYDAQIGRYSSSNNILRHTGVVYSLLLLYEYSGEQKYLDSAKKGIDFLLQNIEYIDDDTAYVYFNTKAKLGGTALAVISLTKLEAIENTGEHNEIIRDLTNFILLMQEDTGKFQSFYIYQDEFISPKDSNIYPGEAMLALVRAYNLFDDKRYLESIENVFPFYHQKFTTTPHKDFVIWAPVAFVELHEIVPEEKYANFVFQMDDYITEFQYLENYSNQKYVGGYGPGLPTTNAGGRTESVSDAYLLAKKLSDETRTERYKKSMLLGSNFLLNLQNSESNEIQYLGPKEVKGAFYHDFHSSSARIDFTQHAISAMIKTLTYIPPEEINVSQYFTESNVNISQ